MSDIEKDCRRFDLLTGMLPPGKSESPIAVGQTSYERCEVRRLLWELFGKMDAENKRLREAGHQMALRLNITADELAPNPAPADVRQEAADLVATWQAALSPSTPKTETIP